MKSTEILQISQPGLQILHNLDYHLFPVQTSRRVLGKKRSLEYIFRLLFEQKKTAARLNVLFIRVKVAAVP